MSTIFSKVLYIGPTSDFGGMGAVLNMYAKYIDGIKLVSTLDTNKGKSKLNSLIKALYKVNKHLVQDKEIKILHIHSASKRSFLRKALMALLGKAHNKKVIFHIHSGSFDTYYKQAGFLRKWIKLFLNKVDLVICLSEEWQKFYLQKMGLSNVIVIGNPIEMHDLNIITQDDGILDLLFLGKICDEKGIFDLLDYLSRNKYYLNDRIRLTIGGNNEVERLKNIIANPTFVSNVKFCGWVINDFKTKYFRACDAYILPSHFEGLPVSILEAMSFGKPVIATNVGGIPSIVKKGYNGWLFDPNTFEQLDDIFDQIFSNNTILTDFGKNSHTTAKQYSIKIIKNKLAHIYQSMSNTCV